MRFASAAFVIFFFSMFARAPLHAQTSTAGVLEIWLKARESADAPNSEKVSLYLKSKALVIGNDGYDGRGWPKLSNGIRDAEEVARGLAAQGFEVTLKKNLTSSELERALKTFFIFEGAEADTRLLIWFAGHGTTIGGEAYIVPVDAPSQKEDAQFRDKAISLRRFGEYMREAKARHALAVFDSCFSGSVFNVARSAPPPAITLATTQQVRQFISSGDAEQQVSDDGTFRKLFLDALAGKEGDADANHDGYVTGTELGLFLQQKVTNLTNNRQTPRYGKLNDLGYDRGDFVFKVGTLQAPAAPPITSTLPTSEAAQAWAVTQNTTSIAVLEEFIRQFETTPYGPMARARLEELKRSQAVAVPPVAPQQPARTEPAPQPTQQAQSTARRECDRLATFSAEQLFAGGDAAKAIVACRQALDVLPNDSHVIYRLAGAHHVNRNFNDALRLYRQAADMGNADALNRLGEIYRNGRIVRQDLEEAARLFRRAADLGSATAVANLNALAGSRRGRR
jgi:Flp pilus assembly protein TadD